MATGKLLLIGAGAVLGVAAATRVGGIVNLSEKIKIDYDKPIVSINQITIPNVRVTNPTSGYIYIQKPRVQIFLSAADAQKNNVFIDSGVQSFQEPLKIEKKSTTTLPSNIAFPVSASQVQSLVALPRDGWKITIVQRTITPVRLLQKWMTVSSDEPTVYDLEQILKDKVSEIANTAAQKVIDFINSKTTVNGFGEQVYYQNLDSISAINSMLI